MFTTIQVPRRIAFTLLASLFSIWGTVNSLRLSYADWLFRRNDTASVERAVTLDPQNASYHAWLAELLEHDGRDPRPQLELASRLNPFDSHIRIELGLRAESDGNYDEAERLLLNAAVIDQLFEPRWTLLNFYFRRGNQEQFWRWVRLALAISYGDRTPLFEVCWRMREDAPFIAALSPDYPVRKQFVQFLLNKARVDAAISLAEPLAVSAPATDLPVFLPIVDRAIENGRVLPAMQIWNRLCGRRLLPFTPLDPATGASLTNGSFTIFPTSSGFDWIVPVGPECSVIRTQSPQGLRIGLSGTQADSCTLLKQFVPLQPVHRYRLRFGYLTTGMTPGDGLFLTLPGTTSQNLSSAGWREESVEFNSGAQPLNTIGFEYHRPLGRVRASGSLSLRDLRLELIE